MCLLPLPKGHRRDGFFVVVVGVMLLFFEALDEVVSLLERFVERVDLVPERDENFLRQGLSTAQSTGVGRGPLALGPQLRNGPVVVVLLQLRGPMLNGELDDLILERLAHLE